MKHQLPPAPAQERPPSAQAGRPRTQMSWVSLKEDTDLGVFSPRSVQCEPQIH